MIEEELLKEICLYWFGGTYEDLAKKFLNAYCKGELIDEQTNE